MFCVGYMIERHTKEEGEEEEKSLLHCYSCLQIRCVNLLSCVFKLGLVVQ